MSSGVPVRVDDFKCPFCENGVPISSHYEYQFQRYVGRPSVVRLAGPEQRIVIDECSSDSEHLVAPPDPSIRRRLCCSTLQEAFRPLVGKRLKRLCVIVEYEEAKDDEASAQEAERT